MTVKTEKPTYRKPADAELRGRLTPLAYQVTRHDSTEPPFDNPYHDEKRDGIYVDIVSGEPLFSSRDKFDSGHRLAEFQRALWNPVTSSKKPTSSCSGRAPKSEVSTANPTLGMFSRMARHPPGCVIV